MSLHDDLARWEAGYLSREELIASYTSSEERNEAEPWEKNLERNSRRTWSKNARTSTPNADAGARPA